MQARRLRRIFSHLMTISIGGVIAAAQNPSADLVVVNAKVWTVNPAQPRAEAVACLGTRILAVGSNSEIRKWIGAATKVVDAGGKLVLPGFNDSHVHFIDAGEALAGVQLRDAKSEEDF